MNFVVEFELELVKERIYNDYIKPIEEYTYVIPQDWFINVYENHLIAMFDYEDVDLDEFLDVYDPEKEGVYIYNLAKQENVIIDEGWCAIIEDY